MFVEQTRRGLFPAHSRSTKEVSCSILRPPSSASTVPERVLQAIFPKTTPTSCPTASVRPCLCCPQFLAADYNAFVLHYSCKPSVYPIAVLEVAEAMRQIRAHADEWNVDTARIAVIGFSAGGHLAADFATSASDAALVAHGYDPDELRPNALMLSYPVITSGRFRHDGSFRALLGERYGEESAMNEVSIEQHIDAKTPPVFVWHTMPDDCVPVENTLQLIAACKAANVPIEAHLYPAGGHGLSLGTAQTAWGGVNSIEPAVQSWIFLAKDWLDRTFAE